MAIPLVVDGNTYNYPEQGDVGYATQATAWANAVTGAVATAETNIAALQAVPARLYVEYTSNAGQTYVTAATTVANFEDVVTDTDSAVTIGAAWHFTVPAGKAGRYLCQATVELIAGAAALQLAGAFYVNGAEKVYRVNQQLGTAVAGSYSAFCTSWINLTVGQTVDFRVELVNTANRNATTTASRNRITIEGPF